MAIKTIKSKRFRARYWALALTVYVLLVYSITAIVPAPKAVSLGFAVKSAKNVTFLADMSWIDEQGQRQLDQQIFDAVMQMIAEASELIVLDMFLFNDWQGPVSETHRPLSAELTRALLEAKKRVENLEVVVISDPINEVYGGLPSTYFDSLRAAGIRVVLTDLAELQDSNPLYSALWRWVIRPFGNSEANTLPNPFGTGRVSVRSYLHLLNFKANHRKLIVADRPGGNWEALISSANPHDGSSAHRNVALRFGGDAVLDVLLSEWLLMEMSGAYELLTHWPSALTEQLRSRLSRSEQGPVREASDGPLATVAGSASSIRIVSEARIEQTALAMLAGASAGDQVDLLMFYLSDRDLVRALIDAKQRGVQVSVLLDVNQDAFGRSKKGVPNRAVAKELYANGVRVRWCETRGEQCHGKMLLVNKGIRSQLLLGSGNYTRRNLENYNLETNVWYEADSEDEAMVAAFSHFSDQWLNRNNRIYSADYATFKNESWWLMLRYRVMEATGIGTF